MMVGLYVIQQMRNHHSTVSHRFRDEGKQKNRSHQIVFDEQGGLKKSRKGSPWLPWLLWLRGGTYFMDKNMTTADEKLPYDLC